MRSLKKTLASHCAGGVTRSWWKRTCITRRMSACCGTRCGACCGRPGGRPGTMRWGGGASGGIWPRRSRSCSTRCVRRGGPSAVLSAWRRTWRAAVHWSLGPWRPSTSCGTSGVEETTCQSIQGFIAHAQRQLGQVERRLLRGEAIAHEEKVFSVFEEHTRWVDQGQGRHAGRTRGSCSSHRRPGNAIHPAPQDPVGGRGRRRGGADGERSPGAVSRAAGVQLRPGLSQP